MPFALFDDRYPRHRKIKRLSDAAYRLHSHSILFCAENLTDGVIFRDELEDVAGRMRGKKLRNAVTELESGVRPLWEVTEDGWMVHDYLDWNRSKAYIQREQSLKAERDARYHAKKRAEKAARDASGDASSGGSFDGTYDASNDGTSDATLNLTSTSTHTSTSSMSELRPDVERVCAHLAARITGNGSKPPTIGQRWRDSARLLIDKDGRTVDQIIKAVDWCQDSEFWRANVMSMPKLREKYDQLRLAALAEQKATTPRVGNPKSTTDERVAGWLALAHEAEAAETTGAFAAIEGVA